MFYQYKNYKMTTLTKKALLYGGGGLVAVIILYFIFKKKGTNTPINTNNGGGGANTTPDNGKYPALVLAKQGTRLRAEPNTNSEILDTFDLGVMLYPDNAKTMPDGVWYHVSEGGWVRSDVVTSPDSNSTANIHQFPTGLEYTNGNDIFSPNLPSTTTFDVDEAFSLSKSGSSISAPKFTLKK
jgi:hypothetical protein